MAVKAASELRVARRYLLLFAIALPLLAALAGFLSQQRSMSAWPELPAEPIHRGRIVALDGTILAEGPVASRTYPQGRLAAQLVGFSGAIQPDGRFGLEGLEYAFDATMTGGNDIRITVDPVIQASAERHLAEAVLTHEAVNGSVVVLEVGSGRILAAANYPIYDPNRQEDFAYETIKNQAFLQTYEPGSVMKPFVVAALLQDELLSPNEMVPAEMSLRVGDKTFRDVARHEPILSVPDVLRYSSNVAMLHLTERFAASELHGWLQRFGFGQELYLPSAFTSSGLLNAWERWVPQDQASVTIGQNVSTTALQLAVAYSIFANDGVYVSPVLTESDVPATSFRVLMPEVALAIRQMLVHTVEASGLRGASIPGVSMAGKTGTADVFDGEARTYVEGQYTLSFAGIIPAEQPRITMIVTLHRPREGSTSTYVAAPLFQAIGTDIVAHWDLVPQPQEQEQP